MRGFADDSFGDMLDEADGPVARHAFGWNWDLDQGRPG